MIKNVHPALDSLIYQRRVKTVYRAPFVKQTAVNDMPVKWVITYYRILQPNTDDLKNGKPDILDQTLKFVGAWLSFWHLSAVSSEQNQNA